MPSILIKVLLTVIFLKVWSLSFGKDRISEMPNLIILLADDLGYGELGCQGNDEIPTPHIDGIAQKGCPFYSGLCYCTQLQPLPGRPDNRKIWNPVWS